MFMTVTNLWKAGPIVQAAPALYKDLQEQGLREKYLHYYRILTWSILVRLINREIAALNK